MIVITAWAWPTADFSAQKVKILNRLLIRVSARHLVLEVRNIIAHAKNLTKFGLPRLRRAKTSNQSILQHDVTDTSIVFVLDKFSVL